MKGGGNEKKKKVCFSIEDLPRSRGYLHDRAPKEGKDCTGHELSDDRVYSEIRTT